ncbi:MAG: ADP-ribosylglycohydrolase family protein, partial [Bacteroidota bacterium]
GNGSLMRILPLVFYIKDFPLNKQFEIIWEVSALTHRHIRAAMSCMIYIKMTEKLLQGENKLSAYQETRNDINNFWNEISFPENEKKVFEKIIQKNICETNIEDLKTGGYVIESLESSFWFFLKNENYKDTVLSIINLGHDTDTSAAI